jgi:hypothetical protein
MAGKFYYLHRLNLFVFLLFQARLDILAEADLPIVITGIVFKIKFIGNRSIVRHIQISSYNKYIVIIFTSDNYRIFNFNSF